MSQLDNLQNKEIKECGQCHEVKDCYPGMIEDPCLKELYGNEVDYLDYIYNPSDWCFDCYRERANQTGEDNG